MRDRAYCKEEQRTARSVSQCTSISWQDDLTRDSTRSRAGKRSLCPMTGEGCRGTPVASDVDFVHLPSSTILY